MGLNYWGNFGENSICVWGNFGQRDSWSFTTVLPSKLDGGIHSERMDAWSIMIYGDECARFKDVWQVHPECHTKNGSNIENLILIPVMTSDDLGLPMYTVPHPGIHT